MLKIYHRLPSSFRIKLVYNVLQVLPATSLTLSPTIPSLGSIYFNNMVPCFCSNTPNRPPSWGLSICSFLFIKCSPPRYTNGLSLNFLKSLFKCHLTEGCLLSAFSQKIKKSMKIRCNLFCSLLNIWYLEECMTQVGTNKYLWKNECIKWKQNQFNKSEAETGSLFVSLSFLF